MAKAIGLLKELSGKIGPLVFTQRKSGKTSVYMAPETKETPTRTKAQMLIRLVWITLAALYTMFHKTLKRGHENLAAGLSDYNQFLSDNTKLCRVYISKTDHQQGGCVLAPVQITRGSLPSIEYVVDDSGVLRTDINLGGLAIDQDTTVADFSVAVELNNDEYEEGDQITFFYGIQTVDAVTEVPRAKIKGFKMKLDTLDETPLWNVVSELGFSTVAGKLGMSNTITDGAAAWIHSREDEQGNLKVSTQHLYVDSSVLASYMGDAAFDASVQSYGGLTSTKKVFLRPDEETNLVAGTAVPSGSGSGSESGSGSSSNSGSDTGSSGSDSGSGSGSGSETPETPETPVTVAAPVFAGETQFTETTQVTMSGPAGATIYYTLDGSTPTASSTVYSGAITLSDTTTVSAVAIKEGVSSTVTTRTYTKGGNGGGNGEGSGDMD